MRQVSPYFASVSRAVAVQHGFTLIELILVIVILALVAVGAAPVLFNDSQVKQLTLQQQALAIFRQQQWTAMQQTRGCASVVVNADALGAPNQGDCASPSLNLSLPPAATDNTRQLLLTSDSQWQLSQGAQTLAFPAVVRFDPLGRPTQPCDGGCKLTISADTGGFEYGLCIESEGYIHSC